MSEESNKKVQDEEVDVSTSAATENEDATASEEGSINEAGDAKSSGDDSNEPSDDTSSDEAASELSKLQAELADEKNKYLRLYAEFENFRRRSAKERLELISSASADLMKEMLPVLDDFQRAIDSNKNIDDIEAVKHGFELLHQKMTKIMASKGLKPIEAKGTAFDAEMHEAIAQVPVDAAEEKGIIIDEVEKGYTLNEKIIRHPKVVVGS